MTGKCPKCNESIAHVSLESIAVKTLKTTRFGVSYVCPSCNCILSVSLDPVTIKSEIISEVVMVLQGGKAK